MDHIVVVIYFFFKLEVVWGLKNYTYLFFRIKIVQKIFEKGPKWTVRMSFGARDLTLINFRLHYRNCWRQREKHFKCCYVYIIKDYKLVRLNSTMSLALAFFGFGFFWLKLNVSNITHKLHTLSSHQWHYVIKTDKYDWPLFVDLCKVK